MAETLRPFPISRLTGGFTPLYEVPAATKFNVAVLHLSNYTSAVAGVWICLTPDSVTTADENYQLIWEFALAANSPMEFLRGDIWAAGSVLHARCEPSGAVGLKLSGIETT